MDRQSEATGPEQVGWNITQVQPGMGLRRKYSTCLVQVYAWQEEFGQHMPVRCRQFQAMGACVIATGSGSGDGRGECHYAERLSGSVGRGHSGYSRAAPDLWGSRHPGPSAGGGPHAHLDPGRRHHSDLAVAQWIGSYFGGMMACCNRTTWVPSWPTARGTTSCVSAIRHRLSRIASQ